MSSNSKNMVFPYIVPGDLSNLNTKKSWYMALMTKLKQSKVSSISSNVKSKIYFQILLFYASIPMTSRPISTLRFIYENHKHLYE